MTKSKFKKIVGSVWICLLSTLNIADTAAPWQTIIRNMPYSHSGGMNDNLQTIRSWVLLSRGYCENPNRHILFDQRGQFLTWIDNKETSKLTQLQLNKTRQNLLQRGAVHRWIGGGENVAGYPFAFNCDQPHVDVSNAMDQMFGRAYGSKIWGTWDGIKAGDEQNPISLIEVVRLVYQKRQAQLTDPITDVSLKLLLAQLLVESGGNKSALSNANAMGILQLTPQVLRDCGIAERFYRHRMAQVDCAVRLYVVNQRNLLPVFSERFGHLPAAKKSELYGLLLLQSYHSGIGSLSRLLTGEEQGKAAEYFAENHSKYSAADIATGVLYHNLGREPWGWASLYYVLDIQIIADALCNDKDGRRQLIC